MQEYIDKYFGKNIPEAERLFSLVSLLSAVFGILFVMFGFIVRADSIIIVLCLSVSIMCIVFIRLVNICHKVNLFSWILLVFSNYLCFPYALMFSDKNNCEMVIYFLVGITFGLVLLKRTGRILYILGQLILDVYAIIYTFYLRVPYERYYGFITKTDYIRNAFAVISTGIMCGVVILYRNHLIITEFEETEDAGKKAEEVSFAKDMFLVNVSHEIRTPLNAIIGTTDILMESDVSNQLKEMAANISNSSHALLSITSDLLDFSRMNTDIVNPANEKYDIAFMLKDVINLMNVRLLDSKVSFYVDINPGIPQKLIGDSGKIRQILVNLLSNAIKYTKEGYIIFKAGCEYEGGNTISLNISVEDTGIGIEPENLEKIFVPYNRSGSDDTDTSFEGNGLGLSFCRKLCESMNARLWAESEPAKGSVFHFSCKQTMDVPYIEGFCGTVNDNTADIVYYPEKNSEILALGSILEAMKVNNRMIKTDDEFICECEADIRDFYLLGVSAYERIKDRIHASGVDWSRIVVISDVNYSYAAEPFKYVLTKPLSSLNVADLLNNDPGYAIRTQTYEGEFTMPEATILLVDDNLVNLEVAGDLMSRYGSRIIKAASGKEGLNVLETEKVDIVFLDYMMPDMDGIDTLKEIRKLTDEKAAKVPVVALTANVVSGAREMFLNEGFDYYLSKPLEREKLEKAIISLVPTDLINFSI